MLFAAVTQFKKGKETYLLVEHDVSGLELLLNVTLSEVVGELVVRKGHARGIFSLSEVALSSIGHCMERHRLVLDVLNLVKVNVRDLFVLRNCGVVRRRVAWQLGEVL